jgi:membrane associated rhomboid family serine protease
MNAFENFKQTLSRQGTVTKILIVNLTLFLVLNLVANISHLSLTPYLALPIGGVSFLWKFWTLFSYMFSHEGFNHFFMNMLLFYFTSQTYQQVMGERTLLYVYVMSGISGGVLLILLGLFFPEMFAGSLLIGASASVLGLVTTLGVYAPNLPISIWGIIETRYKFVAIALVILTTIIDMAINTGGKIAHIGGILFGVIYGLNLKQGRDLLNFAFLTKKKSKLKIVSYQTLDDKYNNQRASEEDELNVLLDKISKSGYDSLTRHEKERLHKVSQKK